MPPSTFSFLPPTSTIPLQLLKTPWHMPTRPLPIPKTLIPPHIHTPMFDRTVRRINARPIAAEMREMPSPADKAVLLRAGKPVVVHKGEDAVVDDDFVPLAMLAPYEFAVNSACISAGFGTEPAGLRSPVGVEGGVHSCDVAFDYFLDVAGGVVEEVFLAFFARPDFGTFSFEQGAVLFVIAIRPG
jgi:hypothetical protein